MANDEQAFREWYSGWAQRAGLDPNPDDPRHHYDYRAAFRAGVVPQIDPGDGRYHFDSRFKAWDHPNRFVNGIDTITGEPVSAMANAWKLRVGRPYTNGEGQMLPDEPGAGGLYTTGVQVGRPYTEGEGQMLADEPGAQWGNERKQAPPMRLAVGQPLIGGLAGAGQPSPLAEMYKMAKGADLRGAVQAPDLSRLAAAAPSQGPATKGADSSYATNAPKGLPWQQEAPAQVAKAAPKQAPADRWTQTDYLHDVATRLIANGLTVEGTGAMAPGPGIVPFGRMPAAFRDMVPKEAGNIVGWDPKKLKPDERELMARLLAASERERAQQQPQPSAAIAALPEEP